MTNSGNRSTSMFFWSAAASLLYRASYILSAHRMSHGSGLTSAVGEVPTARQMSEAKRG